MIHNITLNSPWFEYVRDGKKIYEGRRKTDKTKEYKIGDILIINHHTDILQEPYKVIIQDILSFPTFKDALTNLPIENILPNIKTIDEGVEIYKKYVSLNTQIQDGIFMIKIKLIK